MYVWIDFLLYPYLWYSAQCCPDIALIPKIAEIFEVSIDELMGHKPTTSNEDFLLSLRNKIDSLPKQEDRAFALRLARTLHAVLFLKEGHSARTWDAESVVEQAGKGEWGFSSRNDRLYVAGLAFLLG